MTSSMELKAVRARYEEELLESVVPFWTRNFVDGESGGFYSFLGEDGSVYCRDKYLWMQWRSVYMLAELHMSRLSRPGWLELAEQGFEFAFKHGRRPDGSYRFALDREGKEIDVDSDAFAIFSASFAGLACSALYKATGKEKYKAEAISSIDAYIATIKAAQCGGLLPFGRPMILVNLCDEFMADCGDSRYAGEVEQAIRSMKRFHDPVNKRFHEAIRPDGSFDLDSPQGRLLNPGHALEGMWFLLRHSEMKSDAGLAEYACARIGEALAYGWDARHGGILYFKDALDMPMAEPKAYLKAWWPQNEAAIAALYAYKKTGDHAFLESFDKIDQWASAHFRDKLHGEWYMYRCPDGSHFSPVKGSAYKTLFHVPRHLLRCIELIDAMAT